MKRITRALRVLLAVLLLASAVCIPALAADYQDGSYTVSISAEGLGRHNVVWPTATVDVEDGSLYVTFTFERVDPRDHAPQFDWLKTSLGTFTPTINDAAYTCTFKRVQVPSLGRVPITVLSSAMSQPHEIEYTLVLSDDGIPEAEAPSAEPAPDPSITLPELPATPPEQPSETPPLSVSPAAPPAGTPAEEPSPETPETVSAETPEEPPVAVSAAPEEPEIPAAASPSEDKPDVPEKTPEPSSAPADAPEERIETIGAITPETKSGAVVPIVIAAVVVIAIVVLLIVRGAKKRNGSHEK